MAARRAVVFLLAALLCGVLEGASGRAASPSDAISGHNEGVHLVRGSIDVREEPHHPGVYGKRTLRETASAWGSGGSHPSWGLMAGKEQFIITLSHPFTEDKQRSVEGALKEHGGAIVDYVPSNSFLAVGTPEAAAALSELPEVIWVGEYREAFKVAPALDKVAWVLDHHWGLAHGAMAVNASAVTLHDVMAGTVAVRAAGGGAGTARTGGSLALHVRLAQPLLPGDGAGGWADAGAAAEAEWPQALCATVPAEARPGCSVHSSGEDVVVVTVPPSGFHAALGWLQAHPMVSYVEAMQQMRPTNYYASTITQSASVGSSDVNTPIWAAGLTGEGQIVGCGDTGVDYDHCFFNDPTNPVGDGHRKMHFYREYADGYDGDFHGTHVLGTILGDTAAGSPYRGVAPAARAGFTDIGDADGYLYTPRNLARDFYQYAYDRGVRVHSDSWGGTETGYTVDARYVDLFHWNNKDFLGIFAAGNDGNSGTGAGTVTTPATAKNILSVGASLTGIPGLQDPYQYTDVWQMVVSGGDLDGEDFRVMQADLGAAFTAASRARESFKVVAAHPAAACSPLTNAAAVAGHMVVVLRGGDDPEAPMSQWCFFTDKVRNAIAAGAAAVLVANNEDSGFIKIGAPSSDPGSDLTSVPVGAIPKSTYRLIKAQLDAGQAISAVVSPSSPPEDRWDNVATFSSVGPTSDGRFKPDILAPGENIRSARSDQRLDTNNCGTTWLSGTSMATPVIAGAAALVRQYFQEGYHPSMVKGGSPAIQPSGALIKAVLLNGAYPLDGFTMEGFPVDLPPSYRQGYGRAHLGRSLPLAPGGGPLQKMWYKEGQLSRTGSLYEMCFTVEEPGGELRVTLVWADPPGNTISRDALVNDLDLVVRTGALSTAQHGNGEEHDGINNNEQVVLRAAPAGSYSVQVTGYRLLAQYGPQPFALVVHGGFMRPQEAGSCEQVTVDITSAPGRLAPSRAPSFTFAPAGDDAPAASSVDYECSLTDGAGDTTAVSQLHAWRACTSPQSYSGLVDMSYNFWVRAVGGIHSTWDFTVDATPPVTTLLVPFPPAVVASDTAVLYFSAADAQEVQTMCMLEGPPGCPAALACGEWVPCTSPQAYVKLADGAYTFSAVSSDGAGNEEVDATTYSFAVDNTAPETVLTSAPPELGNSRAIAFEFTSTEGDAVAFECSLVARWAAPEWGACSSPAEYALAADGVYDFQVRGADANGNFDGSPATWMGVVDSVAPDIAITSPVEGVSLLGSAAVFVVEVLSGEDEDSFEMLCALEFLGGGEEALSVRARRQLQQTPCTSPVTYLDLVDGPYRFTVIAVDEAGNPSEELARDFTADSTPPTTRILAPTPPEWSSNTSATFFFEAEDAGSPGEVTTECRFSGPAAPGVWAPCVSPYEMINLADGLFRFSARSTDAIGNVEDEANAATFEWHVDLQAPTTVITAAPPRATQSRALEFEFGTEGGDHAGFQCALVALQGNNIPPPEWSACSSPAKYSKLEDATYEFSVRAYDASFNYDGTFPRALVSVDTAPPPVAITTPPGEVTSASPVEAFFVSPERGVAYKCQLSREAAGGGWELATSVPWTTCNSPWSKAGLDDGTYLFEVFGVDAASNVGPAVNTTFLYDRTAPDVAVSAVATPATRLAAAWSASDPSPGAGLGTVECRLSKGADPLMAAREGEGDGGEAVAVSGPNLEGFPVAEAMYGRWAPCPGGGADAASGARTGVVDISVPDGVWTLSARARDAAGNEGFAAPSAEVLVDTTPPDVAAASVALASEAGAGAREVGADGLIQQGEGSPLAFEFALPPPSGEGAAAAEAAPVERVDCRLVDPSGAAPAAPYHDWRPCTSPSSYDAVPPGEYLFSLRLVDAAGNVSPPSEAVGVAVTGGGGLDMMIVGAGGAGGLIAVCGFAVAGYFCFYKKKRGASKGAAAPPDPADAAPINLVIGEDATPAAAAAAGAGAAGSGAGAVGGVHAGGSGVPSLDWSNGQPVMGSDAATMMYGAGVVQGVYEAARTGAGAGAGAGGYGGGNAREPARGPQAAAPVAAQPPPPPPASSPLLPTSPPLDPQQPPPPRPRSGDRSPVPVGAGPNTIPCPHCGINFLTELDAALHVSSLHATSRHSTPPYSTPRGSEQLERERNPTYGARTMDGGARPVHAHPLVMDGTGEDRHHRCPACGQVFASLSALNNHLDAAHTDGSPAPAAAAAAAAAAARPFQPAGINISPYSGRPICPICGTSHDDLGALNAHIDDAHALGTLSPARDPGGALPEVRR